jgi:UDP-N-acetylmuramoyl-L-alanyl-D-glutamate--2,6-diaminopimelate ligase
MPTKRLSDLLPHIPDLISSPDADPAITSITLDSRQVEPGTLFVAIKGLNRDGHAYIRDAIARGAAAVMGTETVGGLDVPYIRVGEARPALAHLAAAFHDFPARDLTVIGVTGTDGKTTTSNYIYRILQAAGKRVGMISTVNAVIGDRVLDTGFHVTTPEAPDVQRYLAQMVAAGLTHVVLEATSHGLAQDRVAACDFDVGVVTNITHEHLDYHGSYEAYRAAKGRLFTSLAESTFKPSQNLPAAVLNRDDQSYEYLQGLIHPPVRQISYGTDPEAGLSASEIRGSSSGLRFVATGPDFEMEMSTALLGGYNVYNALAALSATVMGLGVEPDAARRGVAALDGIPGRMESIDLGQDFLAIVDFAHTPNALRRALEAVRPMTSGRVIAVFGSAGLRDREKRRLMAEVSAQLADLTVLTAEDPRTESLDAILAEMAAGAESQGGVEGKTFWRVPDRGGAIRFALDLAQPGDVVVACGKGHEQSMCFGTKEYPWDDRTAMRAALADYLGVEGPEMPFLPTQNRS